MEFNEAVRRTLGGHWRLLVVFVLLPMLLVGAFELRDARAYVSTARVQASATLPTTDVQANAMLSRVRAVATSGSVVKAALKKSRVDDRSQSQVGHETTVSRLGGSAVFNLKITDPDPRTAEKLAGALSEELVAFFNGSGNVLVTQLTDRERALQQERLRVAAKLPQAANESEAGRLTAQLGSIDQQILDVQSSLRAAQAAGLGDRTASLLSSASDATPVPPLSVIRLALAGAMGLVAGLLVAALLEVVRPHVAGQGAFGRELGAPVLGRLGTAGRRWHRAAPDAPPTVDADTLVTLRRAAARRRVGTLVLTGPAPDAWLAALARDLESRLGGAHGTTPRAGRAGPWSPAAPSESPAAAEAAGPADSNGGRRDAGGGLGALAGMGSATAVRDEPVQTDGRVKVAAAARAVALRVRALHQVDDVSDSGRYGLVPVEPALPDYAELRRVQDVLATTGWPVVGVLADPVRRHRSRPR
ncbi:MULTISPECIES: hypothetical protein [Streptomyces]|uniref:Uncharacterized protein n=2 Tax=Streptomyces TaxID=1883 RepID=A0A2U9PCA3_STRAS|nr:hypothetical protein [Streptomyces actuosus]AWT46614.1 hypothetical protein DMT42_32850 [Streptomyces actuosus]MBM4823331.1 hypothetical protein [Streptomyces actuosus]